MAKYTDVRTAEGDWIKGSRAERNAWPKPNERIGLAFSGGGIRSATFNLGILQGLVKKKLLEKVDYLSTVSGGGYIGSWLQAWIYRAANGRKEVEKGLRADGGQEEARQIHWLRDYSNYLTPQTGLFSADTWAMVAVYLRNLLLNLLILILVVAAILLLPRLLLGLSLSLPDNLRVIWTPLFLATVAVVFKALNLRYFTVAILPGRAKQSWYMTQGWVQLLIALPLLAAAWSGGWWLWKFGAEMSQPQTFWVVAGAGLYFAVWVAGKVFESCGDFLEGRPWAQRQWRQWAGAPGAGKTRWQKFVTHWAELLFALVVIGVVSFPLVWVLLWVLNFLRINPERGNQWLPWGGGFYLVVIVLVVLWRIFQEGAKERGSGVSWTVVLLTAPASGAVGGFVMGLLAGWIRDWQPVTIVTLGVPLVLLVFTLTASIHIGLMGRDFADHWREWWARLGGWLMLYGLGWAGLFSLALFGPLLMTIAQHWVHEWASTGMMLGWLATTGAGVLAGKSAAQDTGEPPAWKRWAVQIVPYVFIVGLLLLLSNGVHLLLAQQAGMDISGEEEAARLISPLPEGIKAFQELAGVHRAMIRRSLELPLLLYWLLGLAALVLAWRVDINEFSMHLFYRVRLARCYLGASVKERWKKRQPFTGFCREDDVPLAAVNASKGGPYPIINTTLNLTKGDELAWQQRKAASFVFTPKFCGFTLPAYAHHGREEEKQKLDCYRPTENYAYPNGGPFLGTAMGISGAAASPAMGYHTTPALAFLLTVFNVRLGWWMGNPADKNAWKTPGPTLGLWYLLRELFADTGLHTPYLYLSDGGHFENLGIYELVRRRCKLIIACDSGADPDYLFSDLGNAIEKCRTDLGINIKINVNHLKPEKNKEKEQQEAKVSHHYAVGIIQYEKTLSDWGWLVYIKSSLTGDEPADVLNYKSNNEKFPHQTTADQWFDERQFESYRALGEHVAKRVFQKVEDDEPVLREVAKPLFEKPDKADDNRAAWVKIQETLGLERRPLFSSTGVGCIGEF